MITDPPYGVAYTGKTEQHLKIENDDIGDNALYDLVSSAFSIAVSVLAQGSSFYVFHPDSKSVLFRRALEECGCAIRQCLIWEKSAFVMGRQDYQWKHEPCLYGWTPGAAHRWFSDRSQATVMHYDRPNRSEAHPTMKPVEMIAYLMRNSSRAGEWVYDPFGGSGSTLIAAEQIGRRCYTVEIDPRYCDAIVKRWEDLTGCAAEKVV